MPRGARLDAPGTLHHVMVRGIEKRSIVNDGGSFGSPTFMRRLYQTRHLKHMSEKKCQSNRPKSRESKAAVTENKEATDREVC